MDVRTTKAVQDFYALTGSTYVPWEQQFAIGRRRVEAERQTQRLRDLYAPVEAPRQDAPPQVAQATRAKAARIADASLWAQTQLSELGADQSQIGHVLLEFLTAALTDPVEPELDVPDVASPRGETTRAPATSIREAPSTAVVEQDGNDLPRALVSVAPDGSQFRTTVAHDAHGRLRSYFITGDDGTNAEGEVAKLDVNGKPAVHRITKDGKSWEITVRGRDDLGRAKACEALCLEDGTTLQFTNFQRDEFGRVSRFEKTELT